MQNECCNLCKLQMAESVQNAVVQMDVGVVCLVILSSVTVNSLWDLELVLM